MIKRIGKIIVFVVAGIDEFNNMIIRGVNAMVDNLRPVHFEGRDFYRGTIIFYTRTELGDYNRLPEVPEGLFFIFTVVCNGSERVACRYCMQQGEIISFRELTQAKRPDTP